MDHYQQLMLMVFNKSYEAGVLKKDVYDLLVTKDQKLNVKFNYVENNYINLCNINSMSTIYMSYRKVPLISFCGGDNLGAFSASYQVIHRGLAKTMFIYEVIANIIFSSKGTFMTTSNDSHRLFYYACKKLFQRIPDAEMYENQLVNPNTGNVIDTCVWYFGKATLQRKRLDTKNLSPLQIQEQKFKFANNILNLIFNVNSTNISSKDEGGNKSKETTNLRTSEVREVDSVSGTQF